MTEVVAALTWNKDEFMICQHPAHKVRGLLWEFVGLTNPFPHMVYSKNQSQ